MARNDYHPFNGLRGKPLTPREVTALRLYTRGAPVAEIADRLFISDSTVRKDLQIIKHKMGAPNITCALVKAQKLRLL